MIPTVIHKSVLTIEGLLAGVTLSLPNATILSAHVQGGYPAVWYTRRMDGDSHDHHLIGVMTGQTIPGRPEDHRFIGTVLLDDGAFVLHVFERIAGH